MPHFARYKIAQTLVELALRQVRSAHSGVGSRCSDEEPAVKLVANVGRNKHRGIDYLARL